MRFLVNPCLCSISILGKRVEKYSFHIQVPFSKVLYIESSDFRLKDSKDYYGLAPGKTVMLRYCFIELDYLCY
jgi:hypothetical protein